MPALLAIMGLTLVSACAESGSSQKANGPIKVQIPVYKSGKYELEVVTLTSLKSINPLRGEAAYFLYSPKVNQDQNEMSGIEPRIHTMQRSDGVYIPTDSLSIQTLSLYYSMETLMKFDENVGVKKLNNWPRAVVVNYLARDAQDSQNQVRNGAYYSFKVDAMLFTPFSNSTLPLTVNFGAIAHEHFHSLFQRVVLQNIQDVFSTTMSGSLHDQQKNINSSDIDVAQANNEKNIRDQYHATLLRGINEGLADVWGYLLSEDNRFVSRSIPSEAERRDLDFSSQDKVQLNQNTKIENSDIWKNKVRTAAKSPSAQLFYSYQIGAKYARTFTKMFKATLGAAVNTTDLKSIEEKKLTDSKVKMARAVLGTIDQLKIKVLSLKQDEYLEPGFILNTFAELSDWSSAEVCNVFSESMLDSSELKACNKQVDP